ncbi:uncharacterized protein G2W53_005979 [Senna tora]|uniref:Uncharacterized protein n=1 Tax=Senna tora TaxID=362788 RepID=A0A835CG22_9FABA|nr:uncharacterized protein G2W53_005979 [Senna tora]
MRRDGDAKYGFDITRLKSRNGRDYPQCNKVASLPLML